MNLLAYADLEKQALRLPERQRSALASLLIGSLEDEDTLSDGWKAELDKRMNNLDSGATKPVPSAQVHEEIQRRFGV